MVSNFFVFGNVNGRDQQSLVSFEAKFDLMMKKVLLFELVNEVKVSYQGEALTNIIENNEFYDLFFLVNTDKSDLRVSASYMRACTLSFYDLSCNVERHLGISGLRSNEHYFESWVDEVRKCQLELITTIVSKVMCDQVSQSTDESAESVFCEEIQTPLRLASDLQKEAFYLLSIVHHYVSLNPQLYNTALTKYDDILAVTNCVNVASKIFNAFRQLITLSDWFENVSCRDLSGLVIVNTQIGVIEFSTHAKQLSICEKMNCNMSISDRFNYLS